MLDLRQVADEAARLAGLKVVLTERLVAQPGAVRERLRTEIEGCDTYIGLFDRRRGSPTGTDDPRAIAEEEFLLARELGLRCLVCQGLTEQTEECPRSEIVGAKAVVTELACQAY